MRTKKSIVSLLFIFLFTTASTFASGSKNSDGNCDSLEVLKLYSLFSEYHKNRDYASALPYSWQVLDCNPTKFAKWIYYKMEECLWYLHDSLDVSPEEILAIEDTIIDLYDLAIMYYPDDKAYFQKRKAFVTETWLEVEPETVIAEYLKAIEYDKEMSTFYYDRLGLVYVTNMSDENDYKLKATQLYTDLAVREPDNPIWPEKLKSLYENVEDILSVYEKVWELDLENLEKAWSYAAACISAEYWDRAIEPLEFLTQKSPGTINYWNQLATAYQKVDQLSNAENALNKLTELDPDNKDHYFNLGIVYSEQGRYSKARQFFKTAFDMSDNWGMPVFYEAYLYEQAATRCGVDWQKKLIYQLAMDTYRRAKRIDPSITDAQSRINALSGVVPTQEDWFFHQHKSGDVVPVSSECAGWIGRSVTVP